MKRTLPLILALLLALSACGAANESAPGAATETISPIATPLPTLASLPNPGEQPYYIPPMDFAPVSVWMAEPFGDSGKALLYMGEETDGVTPFKVFSSYRYCWTGTEQIRTTDCRSFYGTFVEDAGKYSFSGEFKSDTSERYNIYLEEEACLGSISGSVDIDSSTMTLQYSGASPYSDSVTIYESFDDNAYVICTFNGADFSKIEYLPYRFSVLPEAQIGYAMYQMPAFVEETDTGKLFRGLKTGDNISDILARIPADSELNLEDISCETGVNIYGSGEMNMFGASLTRNEDGSLQLLVCAFDIITYTLDESLDISSIDVFRQTYYLN